MISLKTCLLSYVFMAVVLWKTRDHFVEQPTKFKDYMNARRPDQMPGCDQQISNSFGCTPIMNASIRQECLTDAIVHTYGAVLILMLCFRQWITRLNADWHYMHKTIGAPTRWYLILFIVHAVFYRHMWSSYEGNGVSHPVIFDVNGQFQCMGALIDFVVPFVVLGGFGVFANRKQYRLLYDPFFVFIILYSVYWFSVGITLFDVLYWHPEETFKIPHSIATWSLGVVEIVMFTSFYVLHRDHHNETWEQWHMFHASMFICGAALTTINFVGTKYLAFKYVFAVDTIFIVIFSVTIREQIITIWTFAEDEDDMEKIAEESSANEFNEELEY